MSPLSWSGRQLALFWCGALALSAALLAVGALTWLRPPWTFFWLLPYPGSLRAVSAIVRFAFAARPLEATALVAVPAAALLVTSAWAMGRLLR